ncbi:hypothetical protein [Amycolatopsis sp. EV170708-02-1]|uniref:hypothetical protein n=1 Tax=Amycolatopsis sp. EV170708-02-1 TaxID=2919322 RepID=UPI001F0B7598|nr:hypothetical protein [Amycolatopsis sp. EV170708-02-1]UMP07281.1 hypothetical protein MJQ72_21810 [Amycolatopsis sp. EV170708-02-1]
MRTARRFPVSTLISCPLGFAGALAAAFLARAGDGSPQPLVSVVLMVAVIDAVALLGTARAAFATAAVCWILHSWLILGHPSGREALVFALNALGATGFAFLSRDIRVASGSPDSVSRTRQRPRTEDRRNPTLTA